MLGFLMFLPDLLISFGRELDCQTAWKSRVLITGSIIVAITHIIRPLSRFSQIIVGLFVGLELQL